MNPEEELLGRLREADAIIAYSPLGDEPAFSDFLKQNNLLKKGRSIIADKNISPHDFASTLKEAHAGERLCIFIPGKEFDRSGTRHGRGGGWYDRFLSGVPREWLRIGVLTKDQLFEETLKREAWDEPMDYLLILDDSLWKIIEVAG